MQNGIGKKKGLILLAEIPSAEDRKAESEKVKKQLLRKGFSRLWSFSPREEDFFRSEKGKPYLRAGSGDGESGTGKIDDEIEKGKPGFEEGRARPGEDKPKIRKEDRLEKKDIPDTSHYFNFSDGKKYAGAAFSFQEIGFDLESDRNVSQRVIARLPQEEQKLVLEAGISQEQRMRFLSLWTMKESRAKQTGEGLSRGLVERSFAPVFQQVLDSQRELNSLELSAEKGQWHRDEERRKEDRSEDGANGTSIIVSEGQSRSVSEGQSKSVSEGRSISVSAGQAFDEEEEGTFYYYQVRFEHSVFTACTRQPQEFDIILL
jgi:phosphopantetheinyl transferase